MDAAQGYLAEGRTWVMDVDLEKFFDQVNHDRLMAKIAARVGDKRLLKLIRRGGAEPRGSSPSRFPAIAPSDIVGRHPT